LTFHDREHAELLVSFRDRGLLGTIVPVSADSSKCCYHSMTMAQVVSIGSVPWRAEEMIEKLDAFVDLYRRRPISDNTYGMKSPHLFLAWFVLQKLNPRAIVESGVWRGQGTWFLEQACPEAQLHCIDINLSAIQYRSARAKYYDRDFSTLDWRGLPEDETVLFFDDHQNAYERAKTAKWFGFQHLLLEDNYPVPQGDCYSLKKVFSHSGYQPAPPRLSLAARVGQKLGAQPPVAPGVPPNSIDAEYLRQNLACYCELPPVFRVGTTRWGDPWNDEKYPTPPALLDVPQNPGQQIFLDEAQSYTWMCYARLRR
jgi:hypothetical protein